MKKLIALTLCLLLLCAPLTVSAVSEENQKSGFSMSLWDVPTSAIHPELRTVGSLFRFFIPSLGEGFLRMAGFFLDTIGLPDTTTGINYEKKYITRENGSKLRICVYSPKQKKSDVPGLLWIHGGGYAFGIPEQDSHFIQRFVDASGCVVVAPDYINSVSAPYPAAFDDCYRALLWLKNNGKNYGMRDDKIFVGGNSAGGGLCAAVTLKARDTGDVNIAFQMPLYPMMDDRMLTYNSQHNDSPVWNTKSNKIAWRLYLGSNYQTNNVSKYAAPSRETNYKDLPPTLTYIGTIDPFYDETTTYIKNLEDAGVKVHFKTFEGCYHGFEIMNFYTTPAKQAKDFLIDGFMYAVENYSAKQN